MRARAVVLGMQEGAQTGDTVTLVLPRATAVAIGYPPIIYGSETQAQADVRGACRIVLNQVAERAPITLDHGADELRDSMRPGK